MGTREDRREATLDAMADHLLRRGLPGASLRALAAAAGTSDRMLLYYFRDKDEILAATLGHLARRLAALLDAASPPAPRPPEALLAEVWAALRGPALAPYMTLWIELAAAAARGQEPHRRVAGGIVDGFLDWASARIAAAPGVAPEAAAARLLATVDGAALLAAVGRGEAAGAAAGAAVTARGSPRRGSPAPSGCTRRG